MDIYTNYTKTDTYHKFTTDDGKTLIVPTSDVILIDDESGMISIKLLATRKVIGLFLKP